MHKTLFLKDVCLSFPNKTCFEDFSTPIYPGSRIGIIGRNGSGKSSLLKLLSRNLEPSGGELILPEDLRIGYVEQVIDDGTALSGGQRLNKRLTEALALCPDVLLLDEPTNHLDTDNRKSLMRMLQHYTGTLIIVTHDTQLLRHCIDTLWYIDNTKILPFAGSYDDLMRDVQQKRQSIEKELEALKREKKQSHAALMKEQQRAASSRAKGVKSIDQRKWPTIVGKSKALRAEQTSGKKRSAIDRKKQKLQQQLSDLRVPEVLLPTFSIAAQSCGSNNVLSIRHADIGYGPDHSVVKNFSLFVAGNERVAICGKNASGKSTVLKALLGDAQVHTTGDWHLPSRDQIGYLDQHYSNLQPKMSVIEHLRVLRPDWHDVEVRRHLSDFLFKRNEDVMQPVKHLSGGEKARASLSLIAAKTPRLLVLDEITNNLDLETRGHVIQVLRDYPGAMVVVSHDEDFLQAVGVNCWYVL